jgi:hypothetical protein
LSLFAELEKNIVMANPDCGFDWTEESLRD